MLILKVILVNLLIFQIENSEAFPTRIQNVSYNVLENMNLYSDPCENFYEYACGKWKPERVYTKKDKYSQLKSLNNQVYETIREFLEKENIALDSEYPEQLNTLRNYYETCLKGTKTLAKENHIFTELLKDIGGFPAIEENWDAENFDWITMASHLNKFGCKNLLSELILPTYPFPFQFHKMELGIGIALAGKTSNKTASTAYQLNSEEILSILELYGISNEMSQIITKEVLDFMKNMVHINSMLDVDIESIEDLLSSDDIGQNKTNIIYKQVLEKYMNIAWNISDNEAILNIFDSQTDNDKKFIEMIVQQVNNTKKETVANYLSIKLLYHLHGDQELKKSSKKRFCINTIMEANGYFVSLLYNSTISEDEKKARFEDLVILRNEILKSFKNTIRNANWLDNKTIDQAVLKINKIESYIGQLNGGYLGELILEEIKKLHFTDNYEQNLIQMLQFQTKCEHLPFKFRSLINNSSKALDLLNSAQVNAFYFVLDNSIYIANGILNPPVYSRDQNAAIKYGRMGYILGHEVSHAFDTFGRLFDAEGNMKNWWSTGAEQQYKKKSSCLKKDLDTIFIKDLNNFMRGNLTVDEVLADITGISIAYDSFKRNTEDDKQYELYLNKHLTKEQLFFVSFAQLYCAEYSQHTLFNEIEDEHPTDNFRAEAALKHLSIFSDNFKCAEGSKMNLSNKCNMF